MRMWSGGGCLTCGRNSGNPLGQSEGGPLRPQPVPGLVSQDQTRTMTVTGLRPLPTMGSGIVPRDASTTMAMSTRRDHPLHPPAPASQSLLAGLWPLQGRPGHFFTLTAL